MGMLRAGSFPKPRNDDKGEGKKGGAQGKGKEKKRAAGGGRKEWIEGKEKKSNDKDRHLREGEKGVWLAVEGKKKRAAVGGEADDS